MKNTKAKHFDEVVRSRRSLRIYEEDYDPEVVKRSLDRAIWSPTSSNMQLWEFYRIRDKQALKKISEFCFNQRAARTAPELVVFVARPDKYKTSIQRNLEMIDDKDNPEPEKSKEMRRLYYSKVMPAFYAFDFFNIFSFLKKIAVFFIGLKRPIVREVTNKDKQVTIHKSIALAAQTFMLSIKAEGHDSCPMEGFDSKRVKKYLKLPRKAQINMIISVGKGKYPEGIFYPTWRYSYEEVVKEV